MLWVCNADRKLVGDKGIIYRKSHNRSMISTEKPPLLACNSNSRWIGINERRFFFNALSSQRYYFSYTKVSRDDNLAMFMPLPTPTYGTCENSVEDTDETVSNSVTSTKLRGTKTTKAEPRCDSSPIGWTVLSVDMLCDSSHRLIGAERPR